MDNLGEASAGGGINGIAMGVANTHERESGVHALRDLDGWGRNGDGIAGPRGVPHDRSETNTPFGDQYAADHMIPRPIHPQSPYGPNPAWAAGAIGPAGAMSASSSERSFPMSNRSMPPQNAYPYSDSPYNQYSSSNLQLAPQLGAINPQDLADDDDWGMGPTQPQQKRRSFVPFGASGSSRTSTPNALAAGAVTGAGAAAAAGAGAGAGASIAARDASGSYNAVPGGSAGPAAAVREKGESDWMKNDNRGRKKVVWVVGAILAIIIIGAVVGGVLGSVLKKNKGGGSKSSANAASGGQTSQQVADDNKDELTIKSSEIQALMNNKNLHKVFPGMDYTPLNTQYPECMDVGPSQNNVTRDMAMLSQLTNAVRLYGTDCNQTEMVLTAIDRLELKDMKVWLGVWLGNDDKTNKRQVAQMWKIMEDYGTDRIKGVIIGNEVLFRKDLTEAQLIKYVQDIRAKLDKKIPIATSDLGTNWNAEMAKEVNIVMSNVHPFFAGVDATIAAGWTWNFWQQFDVSLTRGNDSIQQIIAEVGWPSAGGKNCGGSAICDSTILGSVAGISQMNTFMNDWVCQALKNGTDYFWFEAFDEPWKIRYNEPGKEWEDKWGLMDVNRNLKSGVKIPDCGGARAS